MPECRLCSQTFSDLPRGRGRGRPSYFCSAECRAEAGRTRALARAQRIRASSEDLLCALCGASFKPWTPDGRFCSQQCAARSDVRRLAEVPCSECGVLFRPKDRRGKYCSKRCFVRKKDRLRRQRGQKTPWARKRLRKVAERDGWRCHICGRRVLDRPWKARDGDPTVDHLVPRSAGGSDDRSNLALAHNRCNWERNTGGEVQLRLIG